MRHHNLHASWWVLTGFAMVGLIAGAGFGWILHAPSPLAASIRVGRPGQLTSATPELRHGSLQPSAVVRKIIELCRKDDSAGLLMFDYAMQEELAYVIDVSRVPRFIETAGPRIPRWIEAARRELEDRLAAGRYLLCQLLSMSPDWRVAASTEFRGVRGSHVLLRIVPAGPPQGRGQPPMLLLEVLPENGQWLYRDITGVVPELDPRFTLAFGSTRAIPGQAQPIEVYGVNSGITVPAAPGSKEVRLSSSPFILKVVPPNERVRIVGFARGEYPSRWLKVVLADGTMGYVRAELIAVDDARNDEGAFALIGLELLSEWERMVEAPLQEIPIYERFLRRYPQSPYGAQTRLEISRRYAAAAEFARAPWNAGKYNWKAYAEKAIAAYQDVLEKYPNSRAAVEAEIGIA